jgi:hypothetical protein
MSNLGEVLKGLSGFVWPGLIAFVLWRFRSEIASILLSLRQQIASGAAIKSKFFEFRGLDIRSFDARDGTGYRLELADEPIYCQRVDSYARNKNLFLVHRVRPSGKIHPVNKLPTFDVSVYLVGHKNFGKMNDVKQVEYYFGRYFGLDQGEFGTKYVVENGTDGFAVRTNAYGPMLCEARIIFHDGAETTMSRYMDFEGTDYRYDPAILTADDEKLRQRGRHRSVQEGEDNHRRIPRRRGRFSPKTAASSDAVASC